MYIFHLRVLLTQNSRSLEPPPSVAVNEYTSLYIFHGKLVPVFGKKFASLFTKLGDGLGPNSLTPYLSNFSAGSFRGAEKPKSMSEKEALIDINFLGLDGERAKILSV